MEWWIVAAVVLGLAGTATIARWRRRRRRAAQPEARTIYPLW